jgi:hypothetical protein
MPTEGVRCGVNRVRRRTDEAFISVVCSCFFSFVSSFCTITDIYKARRGLSPAGHSFSSASGSGSGSGCVVIACFFIASGIISSIEYPSSVSVDIRKYLAIFFMSSMPGSLYPNSQLLICFWLSPKSSAILGCEYLCAFLSALSFSLNSIGITLF